MQDNLRHCVEMCLETVNRWGYDYLSAEEVPAIIFSYNQQLLEDGCVHSLFGKSNYMSMQVSRYAEVKKISGLVGTKPFMILKFSIRCYRSLIHRSQNSFNLGKHAVLAKRQDPGMLLVAIPCTLSIASMTLVLFGDQAWTQ